MIKSKDVKHLMGDGVGRGAKEGAMSRAGVERVIGRFGSQQRVAELLGIWQTAVSGWVRRGARSRPKDRSNC